MTAADSFTNGQPDDLFTYGPEMARWLEEWVETFDWNIEAAVHVTPLLWSFLDEYAIRAVADDVAQRYRQHRERTPEGQGMLLSAFVEQYIDRVKIEAEPGMTPAALWNEHALQLRRHPVLALQLAARRDVVAPPQLPGLDLGSDVVDDALILRSPSHHRPPNARLLSIPGTCCGVERWPGRM